MVQQSGRQKMILDGIEPRGTFRMMRAHVMQGALGMMNVGSGHCAPTTQLNISVHHMHLTFGCPRRESEYPSGQSDFPALTRICVMAAVYPSELIWRWMLPDGTRILIRPIRPEDRQIEQEFVRDLSSESRYFRFMNAVNELSEGMLNRFTRIDYARELALIAVVSEDSHEKEIAVARYVTNPDGRSCEFAIAVADAWQHRRIGRTLMICLMRAAHSRGLQVMEGFVLSSNHKMLGLMHALGFTVRPAERDPTLKHVSKNLTEVAGPALPETALPAA
jgi:RimJ/RimL family protein N-acetyltransferase